MGKIDELIRQYCPNGVEYLPLSRIFASIRNGFVGTVKGNFSDKNHGVRYLEGKNIHNGVISNDDCVYVSHEFDKKHSNGRLHYGDIVMVQSGHVGESAVVTKELENSNCHALIIMSGINANICNSWFINFYFASEQGKKSLNKLVTGGTIKHINSSRMKDFEIPVPPLPVQEEIVRILDKFTELETKLETELETELEMRQKQYEYYASKLISEDVNGDKYEMVPIERLKTNLTYGYTDKAKDIGDIRFVRITDIGDDGCLRQDGAKYIDCSDDCSSYLTNYGTLLMARTGATFGKTVFIDTKEAMVYASFLIKVDLDNNRILNRFYWHFTQTPLYWIQANKYASHGGQPQFNANALIKVQVPLPSIDKQMEIIAVLDKLNALTTGISESLPAEIKMRHQQYEYYRDKLLTFKRLEDKAV